MDASSRSSDRLHAILDESPIGVSVSRRSDGVIVFANQTFTSLIGIPSEKLIGSPARHYYVDDTQRATIIGHLKRWGRVDHAEVQFRRADGWPFWTLLTIRRARFEGQEVNLAWIYDITERKAAESKLLLAAKVFETANEGILITNSAGEIDAVNAAFTHITGYSAKEAIGNKPSILKSGRHDADYYKAMWEAINLNGRWQGEVWNRRKNGEVYVEWLSIAAVRDAVGQVSQYLGIFSDITSRKEDEEHIWRQANFDALTGLPNRALFYDRLSTASRQARRDGTSLALLFIDLDGFKGVNDAFGHAAGDLLLQEAASRLAGSVRSSDTVARLSGDEFTVLLEHAGTRDAIAAVARKIVECLGSPYELEKHQATVCASIGIAVFPDDADDIQALVRMADAAMYSVKRRGKNNFCFHGSFADLPSD